MLPILFALKGADAKNDCIESAKSFCTRSAYANNTSAKDIYAGNTFSAIGVYIQDAGSNSTSIKGVDKKCAYAEVTYTIKYLRIDLQSFLILEIELFDIG